MSVPFKKQTRYKYLAAEQHGLPPAAVEVGAVGAEGQAPHLVGMPSLHLGAQQAAGLLGAQRLGLTALCDISMVGDKARESEGLKERDCGGGGRHTPPSFLLPWPIVRGRVRQVLLFAT